MLDLALKIAFNWCRWLCSVNAVEFGFLIILNNIHFVYTIFSNKVKLATAFESDQKAPFCIATTPRCRRGHYSFSLIAPLYSWYVLYIIDYQTRRYQVPFLKSLVWGNLGLNLWYSAIIDFKKISA